MTDDLIADSCSFAPPACAPGTLYTPAQCLERLHSTMPAYDPRLGRCSGDVNVGMFFDGTGNNRKADYLDRPVAERRHSNVVRLYHAYPDRVKVGTDGYYRYYVPGVGTPFPEIGDLGGALGSSFALIGEARMGWALAQVFNAVHEHVPGGDLIDPGSAERLAYVPSVEDSVALRRRMFRNVWIPCLRESLRSLSPKVDRILVDVFGFSRGAAQARTWVNWLYGLCDRDEEEKFPEVVYRLAGIPLQVRFMGLFDTVASVGLAALIPEPGLNSNGHCAWARGSLQIHPHVRRCVHYVAAHEVRACFPSDSVRVEGRYPTNAKEWVYPGSHSDVGGGYEPTAQGKTVALARVPGYAMYREGFVHGVPFLPESQLKSDHSEIHADLIPDPATIKLFNTYLTLSQATVATLEQHHRQHMGLYFRYRMLAGAGYARRDFVKRARQHTELEQDEQRQLLMTQFDFLRCLEALAAEAGRPPISNMGTGRTDIALSSPLLVGEPRAGTPLPELSAHARRARQALAWWREQVDRRGMVECLASPAELEMGALLDALDPAPMETVLDGFFDAYVHDSMASFIGRGVNEREKNGHGLFKWRRFFFGNGEDDFTRRLTEAENGLRRAAFHKRRAAHMQSG